MKNGNILISGASIAGPALAYWLRRYGFSPTVVERAPALRDGGQAVDFRGEAHMSMVARMGILEDIRRQRTAEAPLLVIDQAGKRQLSLPAEFTGGAIEILRGDLSRLLYERTKDDVEYVFGDSIASLSETAAGVQVTFERGAPRVFDLVVGADGVHSNVRRLIFGAESQFVRSSGYYVALFTAPNHLNLQGTGLLYNEPGRGVMVYSKREGVSVNVMCVFAGEPLDVDHHDVGRQKKIVADSYATVGWETPQFMAALWDAPDFYFDSISMVHMDDYARGRAVLLGDAGYGATTGGMGAGMAMISSYVLAGELSAAGGDHHVAFAHYQEQLRGYAKACQRVAGGAGPFLAPRTRAKIWRRNQIYRLLASAPMVGLLNKLTTQAANAITLKDYPG